MTHTTYIDRKVVVHWMGFSASIWELHTNGWEVLVENNTSHASQDIFFRMRGNVDVRGHGRLTNMQIVHTIKGHVLHCGHVTVGFGSPLKIVGYRPENLTLAKVAELRPSATFEMQEYDIRIFEPPEENARDLIVDTPTVAKLLSQIEELQRDDQKRILRRQERDVQLEKYKVQARIITAA